MVWNEEFETLPREALEALQLKRLKNLVERVYTAVPYYCRKMEEAGVKPADIKSLADLRKLPFTTKEDLRLNYPFGLFAVPFDKVVRIHASSGTTGKPTVVGYTRSPANSTDTYEDPIGVNGRIQDTKSPGANFARRGTKARAQMCLTLQLDGRSTASPRPHRVVHTCGQPVDPSTIYCSRRA